MALTEVDWDFIVGSLYRSKGTLGTKFDCFKDALTEKLNYKNATCYLIHNSGTYLQPLDFNGNHRVIGWSELKRPADNPGYWEIDLTPPNKSFPANDICDRYVVVITVGPSGIENGAILLGHTSKEPLSPEQEITSCSANFFRYQFGALISEFMDANRRTDLPSEFAGFYSASMDATLDSYIIYDEQDRVVAFSPNHLEYYPWLEGHLKVGARFADVLQVVAYSNFMPDIEGQEEEWIQNRLSLRRGDVSQIDTKLDNGHIIRIRENPLPKGGWVASLSDITLFKETEERLRDREKNYRHLLEASPDAIFILQDGKIVFVNEKATDLMRGQSKQQILDTPYLDLLYENDLPGITPQIDLSEDLRQFRFSSRMVRLDGSIFHADVTYASVE